MAEESSDQVLIRPARSGDCGPLTTLCDQLGYPVAEGEMQRRLDRTLGDEDHALYVAEKTDGRVIGWVQVHVRHLLVVGRHAELGGLVVAEGCRRRGVGRRLLEQAECWAAEQGCGLLLVRSNTQRVGANPFYVGMGYDQIKTSWTFRKVLPQRSER